MRPSQVDGVFGAALHIGLPCLVLSTVPGLTLKGELLWLPLAALLGHLLTGALAWIWLAPRLNDPRQRGVAISGAMIMNLAVVYPFVFAVWGLAGASFLLLLDLGNALLTLSLVYMLCCGFGYARGRLRTVMGLLLRFPPLWALGVALSMNAFDWRLPLALERVGGGVAAVLLLLVLVALGVYSRWPLKPDRKTLAVAVVRGAAGGLVGLLLSVLLGLPPLAEKVLIVGCAAPVGFNTLVFAARAELDRDYAANVVSFSLLCGLIYLPVLIVLLERV
ncbi:AEC family transporter [Motiliproteus sp. SC1-56]|uniref:AEC family transporter n=1 Tax=Motiliproteus sp. SC1-56 TaxID=2799565 RepID=UPI001A8FE0AF